MVDKCLQYRLILYSLGYILLIVVLTGAGLFIPLMIRLSTEDPTTPAAQELAASFLYLHYNFWPVALLAILVVTLHSLLTSHRLAGPLYRFRQVFKELGEGSIPATVRLRNKDFLQSELQVINEMLNGLRSKVLQIQGAEESLRDSFSECRRRAALLDDAETSKFLLELAERGDSIGNAVRAITIRK